MHGLQLLKKFFLVEVLLCPFYFQLFFGLAGCLEVGFQALKLAFESRNVLGVGVLLFLTHILFNKI